MGKGAEPSPRTGPEQARGALNGRTGAPRRPLGAPRRVAAPRRDAPLSPCFASPGPSAPRSSNVGDHRDRRLVLGVEDALHLLEHRLGVLLDLLPVLFGVVGNP